jgi:hypothetical protein
MSNGFFALRAQVISVFLEHLDVFPRYLDGKACACIEYDLTLLDSFRSKRDVYAD